MNIIYNGSATMPRYDTSKSIHHHHRYHHHYQNYHCFAIIVSACNHSSLTSKEDGKLLESAMTLLGVTLPGKLQTEVVSMLPFTINASGRGGRKRDQEREFCEIRTRREEKTIEPIGHAFASLPKETEERSGLWSRRWLFEEFHPPAISTATVDPGADALRRGKGAQKPPFDIIIISPF